MTTAWQPVIGLEVHAQLRTDTKLFCCDAAAYGDRPNTNTCPVCLGMPGVLPVLNDAAVDLAIRAGLALGCTIHRRSVFARKNYFYPDLPKGYQISQHESPLCTDGRLTIRWEENGETRTKTVGIERIHIEEDAGKSLHLEGTPWSLVDYNRTSVPLIEIVGRPELRSADEAVAYMKALREILVYIGVCDGNMEEGSLRCDANVSVMPAGGERFGTRTETKNVNSFRFVHKAIGFEIGRQIAVLEAGGVIRQETRLFDSGTGETFALRSKEESHDYRYFPDPDLPPLVIDDARVERVRGELPELPEARRARFTAQFGIAEYDARVLTADPALAAYFEAAAGPRAAAGKKVAGWISTELLGRLNKSGLDITRAPVPAAEVGRLVDLIEAGALTGSAAKGAFDEMYRTGDGADAVLLRHPEWKPVSGDAVEAVVRAVLASAPNEVEAYRGGKTKLFGWFTGRAMAELKGAAPADEVKRVLERLLAG